MFSMDLQISASIKGMGRTILQSNLLIAGIISSRSLEIPASLRAHFYSVASFRKYILKGLG
jgi:hypothetical protein